MDAFQASGGIEGLIDPAVYKILLDIYRPLEILSNTGWLYSLLSNPYVNKSSNTLVLPIRYTKHLLSIHVIAVSANFFRTNIYRFESRK